MKNLQLFLIIILIIPFIKFLLCLISYLSYINYVSLELLGNLMIIETCYGFDISNHFSFLVSFLINTLIINCLVYIIFKTVNHRFQKILLYVYICFSVLISFPWLNITDANF